MGGGNTNTAPAPRADFDAIEAAVMETARGRWFLAEYARRRRAADTAAVLEAIARLEAKMAALLERQAPEPPPPDPPAADTDLRQMAEQLLRGRRIPDWSKPAKTDPVAPAPEPDWLPPVAPVRHAPDPPIAAERTNESIESAGRDRPGEEAAGDDDLSAWDAELEAPELPAPSRMEPLPVSMPAALSPPDPTDLGAFRSRPLLERAHAVTSRPPPQPAAPDLPRNAAIPRPRAVPPPPLPRVDDPTLTMTRDEKLALFS